MAIRLPGWVFIVMAGCVSLKPGTDQGDTGAAPSDGADVPPTKVSPDVGVDIPPEAQPDVPLPKVTDVLASDVVASDAVASDVVASDVVASDVVAGDVVAGDVVASDVVAGDAVAGDAVASDVAEPDVPEDVSQDAPEMMDAAPPLRDVQPDVTSTEDVPASSGRITIPGGMLTVGGIADDSGVPFNAQPPLRVRVSTFEMDSTEITVAQFNAWWARTTLSTRSVGAEVTFPGVGNVLTWNPAWNAPCPAGGDCIVQPETGGACNFRVAGRENHPINCVNWYTAMAYCIGNGARLPTESEWELAARGTEGRRWPWGDSPELGVTPDDRACWQGVSARAESCVVRGHLSGATPLGLLGMAGGVWEWTADHYNLYEAPCWMGTLENPVCRINSIGSRVVRGGSWLSSVAGYLRPASRDSGTPGDALNYYGFRCARTP